MTTLKATGQDRFHNYFFPFTEGFDYAVANDFDSVRKKVDDMTCAVMMELVQGVEGGVLLASISDFVKQVEALCREKDLLLIIDEVQTGIGRTGSLFCFQQYGIRPDVVTMAKGLAGGMPIGAVLAAESCSNVLTPGTHATTFGGTPIVCAAANAVLDTVGDGQFLTQVREKGEYLKNGILSLGSPNIHGVRGMGLMLGIIVDEGKHTAFANKLIEKGVLAITAGKNAVRLLPPLTHLQGRDGRSAQYYERGVLIEAFAQAAGLFDEEIIGLLDLADQLNMKRSIIFRIAIWRARASA